MKAQFINTKLISLFINNTALSKSISKWVTSNTLNSLQKNGLNMLLTSDDKQDNFVSQLKV